MRLEKNQFYQFGSFRLDPAKRILLRGQKPIPLMPKAFDTLLVLIENRDRLVCKEELMKALWPDSFVEEANIAQNVAVLRKALGDSREEHRYIVTIPGRGYRFAASVTEQRESEETDLLVERHSRSRVVIEEASSTDVPVQPAKPSLAPAKRPRRWLVLSACAVALLAAYWLRPTYPPPKVLRIVKLTDSGHVTPNQTLVTDGPRIYYRELVNGQRETRSISVAGGESADVSQPFPWMDIEDISPDGTSLLVARFSVDVRSDRLTPWLVPLVTGSPKQLTETQGSDFGWSRDGRTFAIAQDNALYILNSENGQERLLVSVPGVPFTPRWSPDGRTIRFNLAYENKDDIELWEVGSDGRNPHPVLPGWSSPAREWGGNWTPDGKYFVFHATRAGATDLWAMRESGDFFHRLDRKPVQLTTGPLTFVRPIPSRDGSKIFAVGVQPRGQLVRYDPDSQRLLPFLGGISADHVHFSKDGQWVAYISFPERTLWRSRADGTARLQLTFPPMIAYLPQWSPDGSRIAFASSAAPGQPFKASIVGRDGGVVEAPIPAQEIGAGSSWAPDGTSLALSTYDGGTLGPAYNGHAFGSPITSIKVLDLKTGNIKAVPGSAGFHFSGWSPDGRYLAAITVDGHRLMLFTWSTGTWRELTGNYVDYPEWSPDSRYIYVNTLMYRNPRVLRIRVPDGQAEEVLRSEGPFIGVYGWWSGPAPDGSLLLLRDISIVDLYALDMRWP